MPSVTARECRFVLHLPETASRPDLHLIKEQVHTDDGKITPMLRWVKNYQRPFYVTLPIHRKHQQKLEFESLENVSCFTSTQSKLAQNVALALGTPGIHKLRSLSNSPYLYGTEVSSSALIKQSGLDKYPDTKTPFSVAFFDTETDIPSSETIAISICFENAYYLGWTGMLNASTEAAAEAIEKYVTPLMDGAIHQPTLEKHPHVIDLIKSAFAWIHQRKPDFLSIWNMDYDIPVLLNVLEKYKIAPESIFCDPSVPFPARVTRYVQGPSQRIKANGKVYPIDRIDRWHTLYNSASFWVIDAMIIYRLLRLHLPKEPSYALDAILNKELGVRKLRFTEGDRYVKAEWHRFMQANHPAEYLAYSLFDSLSMQLLDKKTKDLSLKFPDAIGSSDINRGNSNPRLIANELHFYALKKGQVLNSVGEDQETHETEEEEEDEEEILDLKKWIVTLPAHLAAPGLPLLYESPTHPTKIRAFTYDSDCTSAYPTGIAVLNISKQTTCREIITIQERDETLFRLQNINLFSGDVNDVEYATTMFNLPPLTEL